MNSMKVDTQMKVMIVEDNSVYRQAVASGLRESDGFQCIGEVSGAEDAFRVLDHLSVKPDVILLDLEMPGIHGLDAIQELKNRSSDAHVIVLTQSDNEVHVLRAITCGASGYLLKTSTMDQICSSLAEVGSGGAILDAGVAKMALQFVRRAYQEPEMGDSGGLTARELEVLHLLSNGYVKKEIADRLSLSIHGVDMRMRRIYVKLRVNNVAAAVGEAFRRGCI